MHRLHLDSEALHRNASLHRLEWLETNGLGGWAGSTLSGAHSRCYHGLLVAALKPPVDRWVLISRLDERVLVGEESFPLSVARFGEGIRAVDAISLDTDELDGGLGSPGERLPGAALPEGESPLIRFEKDLFPVFEYQAGAVRIRKTVAGIHGRNTTVILYELLESPGPVRIRFTPMLALRDHHEVRGVDPALGVSAVHDQTGGTPGRQAGPGGVLEFLPPPQGVRLRIHIPGSRFHPDSRWFTGFEFEIEKERGLPFREDLWCPGDLEAELQPGSCLGVILRAGDEEDWDAAALLQEETTRRQGVLDLLPHKDPWTRVLGLAADAFIVRRGEDLRTIIAGYPWFTDWGRDTMISLPGLCLATGRHDEARRILQAFAASVDQGMLPNRFPDRGEPPEYNTVDATLWFFVAVHKYLQVTDDEPFVQRAMLPILRDIVVWHRKGTRHGIRVEPDGLLTQGEPGVQLTWMDAKADGWVVTPRHGKAVEIIALWYNALAILAYLESRLGDREAAQGLEERAEDLRLRFLFEFWNKERGCLYDVLTPEGPDSAVRPNQIFALSLPCPLLDPPEALQVLEVVERKLLTPVGLRTLERAHPDYKPIYTGDRRTRDAAYHQGTVWPWLMGPYLSALIRFRRERGKDQAREWMRGFRDHLKEAGVGTISEVFDADPPHLPRGCFAQAWSVAELLRVWVEELAGK